MHITTKQAVAIERAGFVVRDRKWGVEVYLGSVNIGWIEPNHENGRFGCPRIDMEHSKVIADTLFDNAKWL